MLAAFHGRPVLPATEADLARPVAAAASPPHASLVTSEDAARWVVDGGRRRSVSSTVARRLGLPALPWPSIPLAELAGAPAGLPVD